MGCRGWSHALVLVLALLAATGSSRAAAASELQISAGAGGAVSFGSLAGTIRPGWRFGLGIAGRPSDHRFLGFVGLEALRFPGETTGGLLAGTRDTLEDTSVATLAFLEIGVRAMHGREDSNWRMYSQAALAIGGLTYDYTAVGPDSTGTQGADGALMLAGVGRTPRPPHARRLSLRSAVAPPCSPRPA